MYAQDGKFREHKILKEHGKGIKALTMAQHGGGETQMHRRKPLVCLNLQCDRNHFLHNCPTTSDQEKVKILAAAREKWKKEAEARKARQAKQSNITAKQIAGQAHIQVFVKDVDNLEMLQDV